MTHYSPVDNRVARDSPQDEWIDLHERISQIREEGSPPSTIRQNDSNDGDSPHASMGSVVSPERPLSPLRPAVDSGQTDHEQGEPHHELPDNAVAKGRQPNAKRFLDRLQNGWLWEVLGLVLCILSFGAIVGVISAYSDKEIPHFSYGITVSRCKRLLMPP
jgi:hypothetical protein